MKKSPFSRTAMVLLLAFAIAMFAASALLEGYGEDLIGGEKAGPGSYSASAVGYAGFYDILRRQNRPVMRKTGEERALVGPRGTLIVAEPDDSVLYGDYGTTLMTTPRLLIVLPKWSGQPDSKRPDWIAKAVPAPIAYAEQTLAMAAVNSAVIREDWPTNWDHNDLGVVPSGSGWTQLIRSEELRPVVGSAKAMLVGELRQDNKIIWVLSDPDVMANHGIGRGDNAAFMTVLVDRLRSWNNDDDRAPVVFDETVHGFRTAEESPVKLLFRFPFVVVTALLCASAILLARAGTGRFGAARTPPPEMDFGKSRLIGNGARLLDYAGHHALVLSRYTRLTARSAAAALHAPPGLDEPELARWLDRVGKARGVNGSCADILQAVDNTNAGDGKDLSGLFACARNIHRWKGELLHGTSAHRRDR